MLVVGVDNPSARAPKLGFSAGDVLDGAKKVLLPKDTRLTLIDGRGRKIEVRGPFEGLVDDIAATLAKGQCTASVEMDLGLVKTLAKVFEGLLPRALRSGTLTDPWAIDVSRYEHGCYRTKQPLALWRRVTAKADVLYLKSQERGDPLAVEWPVRQGRVDWPPEVPLEDGGTVVAWLRSNKMQRSMTLHRVPDDLPTRIHQAAWMAEQACEDQARLLVLTANVDRLIDSMIEKKKF